MHTSQMVNPMVRCHLLGFGPSVQWWIRAVDLEIIEMISKVSTRIAYYDYIYDIEWVLHENDTLFVPCAVFVLDDICIDVTNVPFKALTNVKWNSTDSECLLSVTELLICRYLRLMIIQIL